VAEVLRWLFLSLIVVWIAGWFVGASRFTRGRTWADDNLPGCLFGMVWMALGLLLFTQFPKLID
jgi:hypothetical protein